MSSYKTYKDIGYDVNPFKEPDNEYDELAALMSPLEGGEPYLMIHTPDIERYAYTEEEAKSIIDKWIKENGSYEFYIKMQMRKSGIPF